MSDHKYERDEDREVTPSEIKNRLIVLMENGFEMPSVHIYDEPVRYLKMNLEWFKIFSGMLSWMEHPAFWKDAEDYDFEAIQQILLFEEGIEPIMATQEDIAKGLYQAFQWLALQVATGKYANIALETDEEGVVTLPDSSGGAGSTPLPEDDPTTGQYNEKKAAKMGVTIQAAIDVQELLTRIDTAFGTDATFDTPLADLQATIKNLYTVDAAAMDTAIANYYTYRAVPNGQIGSLGTTTLYTFLYCNGYGKQGFGKWVVDGLAITFAKEKIITDIINALDEDFFQSSYDEGITHPSTLYLDAGCEPVATQTLDNLLFGVARNTTPLKANHRMLMTVEGYAQDVDLDIQDWFWYRTAAGVNTFTTPTFTHSAGTNLPSQNQVVYRSDHKYVYTIDLQNLNNFMTITMNKHANMNAAGLTYPTPFKITLQDLGEIS